MATLALLAESTLVGLTAVLASTLLYACGVLYVVGLSIWAQRYGGSVAFGVPDLLGSVSELWLAGLLIFGAAFYKAYGHYLDEA